MPRKKYEALNYTVDNDSVVKLCDAKSTTPPQYVNWPEQWAYEETDAVSAVDYYTARIKPTINIAVIDSGVNYNHELLKSRVVRTKVDFSTEQSGDEMDTLGYGTNVAGVIAKSTPSNVKIYAYKFFDKNANGTSSQLYAVIEYINQLSKKPDIINCSFGDNYDGLGKLVDEGVTVVVGAGNDNKNISYSKVYDNFITVAATNYYGKPCSFTNYGTCVDISAPGEYVYTADMSSNTAYEYVKGTSISTPFTSVACAYVLMEHSKYTPEQVKEEIKKTAIPFKKSDCYNELYGAGIVNFSNIISGTRCKDVTANLQSGVYRDDINVELKSANTLVDIYYTTDGTLPSKTNGTKYTEPIKLTETTRINAVAFARAGTPFHSKFTTLDYYILKDGQSEFVVDDGTYWCGIKAYLGNDTDITIPDIVNGVIPSTIGRKCFMNSNLESITLPSSIDSIFTRAFYGCSNLKNINLSNVQLIGPEALANCPSLTDNIDLSSVIEVDPRGLAGTYFKTIALPKCNYVGDSAFEGCAAQEIILNKVTDLGKNAFKNCSNLETIYAPMITNLGVCDGCKNLQTIFAPMLESITVGIPNNTTIYCTRFLSSVGFSNDFSEYKYTFVSPSYTGGLIVANNNGYQDRYNHISSDSIGESLGAQIRTKDNGLRFGFKLDDNNIGFDFKKYANTVDYGFVYTYKSLKDKDEDYINDFLQEFSNISSVKSAAKRNVDGTVSTYNAVFTDIPAEHINDEISARAYVNIDGMYFYSPVATYSLSGISNYGGNSDADNDIKYDHVHSYVKRDVGPFCVTKGYTMYECRGCGKSYIVDYIDPIGHKYKFVEAKNGSLNYECPYCDDNITKSKSKLPVFIDYVNTKVERGNDNMYLDLNKDGYVNAKDFALLNKVKN